MGRFNTITTEMKFHFHIALASIILIFCDRAHSNAIWRVERAEQVAHILGTVHVGKPNQIRLSTELKNILQNATTVFFEVKRDIALDKGGISPRQGKASRAIASKAVLDILAKCHSKFGIPETQWENNELWVGYLDCSSLLISSAGYHAAFGTEAAVERHIASMPKKPTIDGLETIDEQLRSFRDVPIDALQEEILHLGEELKGAELNASLENIIVASQQGGEDLIAERVQGEWYSTPSSSKMAATVLESRSTVFADRIEMRFGQHQASNVVYCVGLAHLPLNEGLLNKLRKRGFKVTKLKTELN